MNLNEYIELLKYFDSILWDMKTTDTNWNYYGLMLDDYLDFSILSMDYMDIEDYFSSNGGYKFSKTELLTEQFKDVNGDKRIKLIENILNIFKQSTYDKDISEMALSEAIKFLEINDIVVKNSSNGFLQLSDNNIIGEGYYCVIKKMQKWIYTSLIKSRNEFIRIFK
jgi:eukaryotic-like serine/threonine-protein kinase